METRNWKFETGDCSQFGNLEVNRFPFLFFHFPFSNFQFLVRSALWL